MSHYGDVHRLFLQTMMSHRVLTENSALAKLQKVHQALKVDRDFVTDKDLKQIIKQINGKIDSLNMEIRNEVSETTSENFVLLVNTTITPINRTMAKYSESELEFFKKIVDNIVTSDGGKVSSITCLNIFDKQRSKADQEALMKRFVDDMWLVDEEGKLSLSVRSISELAPYLRATYNDYLLNCALCKELTFQGFLCQHCPAICHRHCLTRYAKRSANLATVKCPSSTCTAILANIADFIGLDEAESPLVEERPESPPRKKARGRRNSFSSAGTV